MVLWPVRAALEAGAGRVVVVDSPERALERVLPEGVELAVQERPNGTGGAVAGGMSHLDSSHAPGRDRSSPGFDPDAPVVVLSGDVPLVSAEAIGGLIEAHRRERRRRHDGDDDPRGPQRLRAGRARRRRSRASAWSRPRSTATPRPRSAQIREVNTGIFVFAAHAAAARRCRG